MEATEKETGRYCDLCKRWIGFGDGGESNWNRHIISPDHKKKIKPPEAKSISRFFTKAVPRPASSVPAVPAVPRALAHSSPAAPEASSSRIIDVDAVADQPASVVGPISGLREDILARLRAAITTLPQSVPVATEADLLALFAVNPVTLVQPDTDPWEEFIHDNFDTFLLDGPRHKTTIELSELIRRGELGMEGFLIWLQRCFFELHISPEMVEDRIARIIHAMVFLGATTAIAPLPPPVATTATVKPLKVSASPPRGCIGQEMPLEPGKKPTLSYPLSIHAKRDLPWTVTFGNSVILRSNDCRGPAQKSGTCTPCAELLRTPVIKGILERNKYGPRRNTPYAYLTTGHTQALLHKKEAHINNLKLSGLNLARKLMVRATHLEEHSRFVLAVSKGDVPRIGSIVANCMKHGDSIFATTEKLSRAAIGAFHDRSYSHISHQQLYLFLQLGGPAAAELAHRCLGLPSINATRRHIATKPLVASPKSPTMDEMLRNLDTAFPTPFPASSDGTSGPGFQIMLDELKVEGRMRWEPRSNMILGLCREHSGNFELEFRSIAEAEAIHEGLAANTVHLASEATVGAVSSFSASPTRNIAHPFIIAPTCKRETGAEHKILLATARDAVQQRASHIGGRLYCISSDGDHRRRFAALALAFTVELDRDSALFKKLGDLPLFDYHCGRNELTMDIDFKHLFKRFRNTLIRLAATTIDGVVLTRQLLKTHLLRDSKHSPRHIDSLLNPNDRQNVKLMYDLLSAIATLPESLETDNPAVRGTRRVLRLLGALYRHVLEAYTNIKLSLGEQLTHISAAMHLMMAIYKREAGKFVPSQTYFDFMTAGKNIFFCVAKTQIDDPNGQFWLILLGTDPLELSFGKVRTISKGDSNTDMFQLAGRLTAAVECQNIFGEHPEWSRGPHRLRLPVWQDVAGDVSAKIDHISARSWEGDTYVKNHSTKTTWFGGRKIAEGELRAAEWDPPFESMERQGHNIYCPIVPNKMILVDPPEPDERDEDEDECDTSAAPLAAETPGPPPDPPSDSSLLPDFEELAQEAVTDLAGTPKPHDAYLPIDGGSLEAGKKTQHKSTILRIYSSRFSVAESKDRLKRVRGHARHNESAETRNLHSDEAIPGEPMLATEDPAAVLVRSNGHAWLAVVIVSAIASGPRQVETLPTRLLAEPNVRLKVQLMELLPTTRPPRPNSEEGDWEWSSRFVKTIGAATIIEVAGSLVQLLNPAVLPATANGKGDALTYHFKSAELVAITAAMELQASGTNQLTEVAFGPTFPYRTAGGYTCFICNKDGSSLEQEEGLCARCPTVSLNINSPAKMVEHMAIHMLFDLPPDEPLDYCGFCLSANPFCSIQLKKRKGRDGKNKIDLEHSRCPNLGNLGLVNAAKSSQRAPCTNHPDYCPIPGCADIVWKYSLPSHITTVHPAADLSAYTSYSFISPSERSQLKTISTKKQRQRTGKKINFKISEAHSTQSAFGTFDADEDDALDIEHSSESDGEGSGDAVSDHGDENGGVVSEGARMAGDDSADELDAGSGTEDETEVARAARRKSRIEKGKQAVQDARQQPMSWHDDSPPSAAQIPDLSRNTQTPATADTPDEDVLSIPRPKPRRIVRTANTTTQPAPTPALDDVSAGLENAAGVATRRSVREKRVSKRMRVDSSDEEDQDCAANNCTETGELEMVECSGPACGSKFHLCCVGLKKQPDAPWFCDDECRKNAGGRSRKKMRA
ncbi:hypothetical protein C8R46DRAFT_1241005 [Mycena filopes]|nr:hypothetical protein C8R46DRAFT_1241005 [Mycena filopes]